MYNSLFSEINIQGLILKNRLTMAPLYLGYAGEGGTVSEMLLEHYRIMAQSGVAMVVVENSTVDHPLGSGSNRTLRADIDDNLDGLKKLATTIKKEGALSCLQINHAGRFAHLAQEPVAPSAVKTFGRIPRALEKAEIDRIIDKYANASDRAKTAGFDMVELHGGTGYLLAQFLSPRTNQRTDQYGGNLENRQRFALEVLNAGPRCGEWLPGGVSVFGRRMASGRLAFGGVKTIRQKSSPIRDCVYFSHGRHV